MDMPLPYYNFQTGEYEYRKEPPEDWAPYIPPNPATQIMYIALLKLGKSPLEAATYVLSCYLGEKPELGE